MWGPPPSAVRGAKLHSDRGKPPLGRRSSPTHPADEASAAPLAIPPCHAILTPCSPHSRHPARPLIPSRSRCISPQGKAWISSGKTVINRTILLFICATPVLVPCVRMSGEKPVVVGEIPPPRPLQRCRSLKRQPGRYPPRQLANMPSSFRGTMATISGYIRGHCCARFVRVKSARRRLRDDSFALHS